MGVFDNAMYSYDAGIGSTLPEQYIQRKAMKNVQPNLGYLKDADLVEQPKNGGKHVRMWRYVPLLPVTKPLYEGVTPPGQKISQTAFDVMTKPYGDFVPFTDELDLFHVTKKTDDIANLLIDQARLSVDTVGRDQICAGLNVMYPGSVVSRAALTDSDVINYNVIKKAVRNLKRKGAQPFPDGFFHAKVSHDTYHDLFSIQGWNDIGAYQDKSRWEKGELGNIHKVKFYEVDNAKIFAAETYLYGSTGSLTAYADFDVTNREMTVTATMTEDQGRELTGKMVYVQYKIDSTTYDTPMCVERVYPSGTANQTKIKFRWVPGTAVTDNWTTAKTLKIVPSGGATSGDEVHATIIYGQHAFGMVNLGSKSKNPPIQIIWQRPGSAGVEDPLAQRGSIAWKCKHFACAVLNDDFIVRIEHGVSA
jgi:N4-gp56 family major capsid protein